MKASELVMKDSDVFRENRVSVMEESVAHKIDPIAEKIDGDGVMKRV